jgi:hypothetical protein
MADIRFKVPSKVAGMDKKKALIAIIAVLAVASAGWYAFTYLYKAPITTYDYKGQTIAFRADLREAAKVPVDPSADLIYRGVINPLVKNITIAFKDAGDDNNPLYIVEEMEIIPKTQLGFYYMLGSQMNNQTVQGNLDLPGFNAIPVDNYANLPGKIQDPIIALIHPRFANETSVRMDGHVVYISGKTKEDLDKATVRFLMIVLDIDPSQFS